VNEYSSYYSS